MRISGFWAAPATALPRGTADAIRRQAWVAAAARATWAATQADQRAGAAGAPTA